MPRRTDLMMMVRKGSEHGMGSRAQRRTVQALERAARVEGQGLSVPAVMKIIRRNKQRKAKKSK